MDKKGYTLIEILVGLTIVGLIFGIGYVNFRDFSRRQALVGYARIVKGDLRIAQESALAGKKPSDVFCDTPNTLSSYYFNRISGSTYRIVASCTGGDIIVKEVVLPSDVSISISSNPVVFRILGLGTNVPEVTPTTITLTQAATGSTRIITVTSGGEIK